MPCWSVSSCGSRAAGTSEEVIRTVYIPMAGHVLGMFLKPHASSTWRPTSSLPWTTSLAKGPGPDWTKDLPHGPGAFRRFLLNDRGLVQSKKSPMTPPSTPRGCRNGW